MVCLHNSISLHMDTVVTRELPNFMVCWFAGVTQSVKKNGLFMTGEMLTCKKRVKLSE